MIKRVSSLAAITALAATVMLGAALPAQAALRHIDGTVVSKSSRSHSFRVRTQSGNQIRVRVTSSTKFQRIAGGFGGLHKGLRIEVDAKSTANGLVATQVETPGGGGNGGGGDNGGGHGGGGSDGPNHG